MCGLTGLVWVVCCGLKMSPVSHKWFRMKSWGRAVLIWISPVMLSEPRGLQGIQEPVGWGWLGGCAVKAGDDDRGDEKKSHHGVTAHSHQAGFCISCWNAVHMHSDTLKFSSAFICSCLLSRSAYEITREFHSTRLSLTWIRTNVEAETTLACQSSASADWWDVGLKENLLVQTLQVRSDKIMCSKMVYSNNVEPILMLALLSPHTASCFSPPPPPVHGLL